MNSEMPVRFELYPLYDRCVDNSIKVSADARGVTPKQLAYLRGMYEELSMEATGAREEDGDILKP